MGLLDELTPIAGHEETAVRPDMFPTRRSAALVLLGAVPAAAAVLRLRSPAAPVQEAAPASFDETYRGRRISGVRLPDPDAPSGGSWQVTVDGRPLHLMRRADGTYLSMVDHYESYPGPLAAARGAVAELGDQGLRTHDDRPEPARDRKV
ncbi:tyrosinase family oxidase copper chaperone [Streptomyces sp. NPDC102406]|uniref:tyrosinase family oxidase copper chaperone n=1 Tax=Streptomyces sp. NPDC102406 TaxID=3366171 RepID=UPI0037F92918